MLAAISAHEKENVLSAITHTKGIYTALLYKLKAMSYLGNNHC